jgi:hypothetical protein
MIIRSDLKSQNLTDKFILNLQRVVFIPPPAKFLNLPMVII